MTRIARGGVPACVFNPVERLSFDAFSRRLADVRARRLVRFGITLHICQSGIVPVFVRVFDSQTEQEHGSCDNAVCETNWGMDYLPRACRPIRQAFVFVRNTCTHSKPRRQIVKRATMSFVLLACLVVGLLIVTAFTAASSANAQLGNTGVPVRCRGELSSGNSDNLSCKAADGTTFTNVPTDHYLLVTDVLVDPGGPPDTPWVATLLNSATTWLEADGDLSFSAPNLVTVGEHFTTPYLVLHGGQYLHWSITGLPGGGAGIFVSGLLTTNYSYAPLIAR